MAKKKSSHTEGATSRPTARWIVCPGSGVTHPGTVCIQVYRRARAFARCSCGTHVFLGPGWRDTDGMTAEAAQTVGVTL